MAASKELSIYLRDHLAGSVVGFNLGRRAARENRGNDYGTELSRIAAEIGEDREVLRRLADALGIRRSPLKEAGAVIGERLGRLKTNGRLAGYSPLSRMVELEALMLGVSGKLALWQALRATDAIKDDADFVDLELLVERALAQRDTLEELRRRAAREALLPAREPLAGGETSHAA